MMKILALLFLFQYSLTLGGDIYFPPNNSEEWEPLSPAGLEWDENEIDSLYHFLDNKNTKAFILLKDGRIVLEKYFGSFACDSLWYWASAGKTVTAALIGIAQEEGLLAIDDYSSDYLGKGWTSLDEEKENLITIRHQLTMTTGLDDSVDDSYCTEKECLVYKADAGNRWAYHNAPYTLLDKILENASGQNFNNFYITKLRDKTGMKGLWVKSGFNNLCISDARSMARFGILIQNNGDWNGSPIISDKTYFNNMITTSQDINQAYGYLWWLNGKDSFMLPGLQYKFKDMLFPDAPEDVIAALGKNGQCLNISNSTGIVFVRMGNSPDTLQLAASPKLSNEIWKYIDKISGGLNSVEASNIPNIEIYPQPATDRIRIEHNLDNNFRNGIEYKIFDILGNNIMSGICKNYIDISALPSNLYYLFIKSGNSITIKKLIILR